VEHNLSHSIDKEFKRKVSGFKKGERKGGRMYDGKKEREKKKKSLSGRSVFFVMLYYRLGARSARRDEDEDESCLIRFDMIWRRRRFRFDFDSSWIKSGAFDAFDTQLRKPDDR